MRAYADSGLDEANDEQRLAELDDRIAGANAVQVPELEAVAPAPAFVRLSRWRRGGQAV